MGIFDAIRRQGYYSVAGLPFYNVKILSFSSEPAFIIFFFGFQLSCVFQVFLPSSLNYFSGNFSTPLGLPTISSDTKFNTYARIFFLPSSAIHAWDEPARYLSTRQRELEVFPVSRMASLRPGQWFSDRTSSSTFCTLPPAGVDTARHSSGRSAFDPRSLWRSPIPDAWAESNTAPAASIDAMPGSHYPPAEASVCPERLASLWTPAVFFCPGLKRSGKTHNFVLHLRVLTFWHIVSQHCHFCFQINWYTYHIEAGHIEASHIAMTSNSKTNLGMQLSLSLSW